MSSSIIAKGNDLKDKMKLWFNNPLVLDHSLRFIFMIIKKSCISKNCLAYNASI